MCPERVTTLILSLLILLDCVSAAPSHRYSSSGSSEQDVGPGWSVSELASNPFWGLLGPRLERELPPTNSHSLQKRKCNTATCVTQRLADFLVRSSNTIGTVYAPTNVGSAAYGKRSALSPPVFMPL
ncbi:calcitonin gene-related peptide 1 [Periophthalmus magnuspinnatus]|uniref:calcitonin gene-related peptide 1 n=1 Tax=Periophthalmus magnuspinnatus TaxID=409849 RepID=UPI00145B0B46|nr:calcitonin gene-related peptide 1 [Periophthalmus magnuspinnatus]